MEKTNIAEYLPEMAAKYPNRRAVIFPQTRDRMGRVSYTHLTFTQLNQLSDDYACEFRKCGISKGTRTVMLLRPSLEFIAAVFAVFKTGAVPILIDPGMGRNNLLNCIAGTDPEALIAVSEVHWAKLIFRKAFKTVKTAFSFGPLAPPGVRRLEHIEASNEAFNIEKTELEDMAAILFTTGSTGPPKGVVYTHRIFITQTELIRNTYGAGPTEMDMPAFPLFALFASALGMSCVIPDMDPTRPANVDPENIIEAVKNQDVSFSFGSPALWRTVATYCIENKIRLQSLKRVLMAGAPVSAELHKMVKQIIAEDGETMVPYGATESLPVATFTGTEMIAETAEKTAAGKGYCVGYPLEGITIKIIKAVDDAIETWDDSMLLPDGEIGEIVIKGDVVTPEYFNAEKQTKFAKIADADNKLWHRMGDVGYFDEKGRLWFCGRKGHRVINEKRIYYPVCCEAIFNKHPDVFRTALVGAGTCDKRKPVLLIELKKQHNATEQCSCGKSGSSSCCSVQTVSRETKERILNELKELGKETDFTSEIDEFLFHSSFPVDIRHNAKIFREKLSVWAESQLR